MKAAIIDLETTGLKLHPRAKPELQPRCIEFGGILLDTEGSESIKMSQLIYPEQKISAEITKITGITNDDLKGKPVFAKVAKDITDLISKADAVVAHNLPFDKGILCLEFERLGIDFQWPPIQLCTVQENVPVYGYRIKLKDLFREVTGEPWTQKHRALDDCKALARVVMEAGYLEKLI